MRKRKKFILLSGTIGVLTTSIIVPAVFIANNANKNDYLKKISYTKSFQPIDLSIDEFEEIKDIRISKTIKLLVLKNNENWKNILFNNEYKNYVDDFYQTYWTDEFDVVLINVLDCEDEKIDEILRTLAKHNSIASVELNNNIVPLKENIPDLDAIEKAIKNGQDETFKDVAKRYADPLAERHFQIAHDKKPTTTKIGVIEVEPLTDVYMEKFFSKTKVVNYDVIDIEYAFNNPKLSKTSVNLTFDHPWKVSLLAAGEHSINKDTELHFVSLDYKIWRDKDGYLLSGKKSRVETVKQIDLMIENGVKIFNNSYGYSEAYNLYKKFLKQYKTNKKEPTKENQNKLSTIIERIKKLESPKYKYSSFIDEYMQNRALHKGAVFIFATGNEDDFEEEAEISLDSPYFENLINLVKTVNPYSNFYNIAVGANDKSGMKTDYSSYINSAEFSDQPLPLVTALGNIERSSLTKAMNGTSFSSPIVTNIVSYLLKYNSTINSSPEYRNQLIRSLLSITANKLNQYEIIHKLAYDNNKTIVYKNSKNGNYDDMFGAGEVSLSNIFKYMNNIFTKKIDTKKTWYGSRKLLSDTEIFRFNKQHDGVQELKIALSWFPILKEYKLGNENDINKNSQKLIDDLDFKVQWFNKKDNKWVDILDYSTDKLVSSNIEMKIKNIDKQGDYRVLVKETKRNTTRDGFYIGGAYALK